MTFVKGRLFWKKAEAIRKRRAAVKIDFFIKPLCDEIYK
jgi:hypothetical protein